MTRWYRVHFRKSMIVVEGDAELARIKARKVPQPVLIEPARVYRCKTCSRQSAWPPMSFKWGEYDTGWRWFGCADDRETVEAIDIYCSYECEPQHLDRFGKQFLGDWKKRPQIHYIEPQEFEAGRWKRLRDAQQGADPRRFPMPEYDKIAGLSKREGQCRWCGGRISTDRAWQRSWHRRSKGDDMDCMREWLLHTNLDAQWWHLVQRDGIGCSIYGKGEGRWLGYTVYFDPNAGRGTTWLRWSERLQVDHIIPLWKVAHLPPAERLPYFGPDNLWLLSERAHVRKTAMEATERAEARK